LKEPLGSEQTAGISVVVPEGSLNENLALEIFLENKLKQDT